MIEGTRDPETDLDHDKAQQYSDQTYQKAVNEQLQDLCNKQYPGKNTKIVNFGIPGSNSRQAFNYFKHVLTSGDYARPNAVILMTEMNDW
ncbi:MAG: hypothetical protein V1882_02795 [Candidatus Omnitrophota bacterium]